MRKIKLYIANSLDNYIARENGDVDWLFIDGEYGMAEFYASVDTVLMGRKTIEKGNELGQTHYKGMKNYVFSKTIKESEIDELEYISEDLEKFASKLKRKKGKDIWLVGGGDLIRQFLDKNLVDEIFLFVHPILLGKGLPLFLPFENQIDLKLIDTEKFENGVVKLAYAKK
ncbi:MAG: dihydrofolate reductase [Pyrinomonadaceae bacterium]|nr:dihydrofolate reductase [Pyrinomonadaceae bacterium]